MKGCCRVAPILTLALTFTAWAQQTAKTAPPATENAQQLASAMQVVQRELNTVGKLTFVVDVSNADEKGTSQYSVLLTNVVADPATCTIRYHFWRSMSGKVVDDDDVSIGLHDVLGISTMSAEEAFKEQAEKEGATPSELEGFYEKFDPPMFVVAMRMPEDADEGFSFTDQKQASRVGQAVVQAVKLCGGKTGPY